jgi:hypothetical protein
MAGAMLSLGFACNGTPDDVVPAPPAGQATPAYRAYSSPPTDPDSVITVTLLTSDGNHGWKVAERQTMTKRQAWLSAQASAEGREVRGGVEGIESAAVLETCWHGSNIVMWDDFNWTGNMMCVRDDGVRSFVDLADYNFQPRSYYTVVPVCIYDTEEDINAQWYQYAYHDSSDIQPGGLFNEWVFTPEEGSCPTIF